MFPPEMIQQIKDAGRLAGARWLAWLAHEGGSWNFGLQTGLSQTRQKLTQAWLAQPDVAAWLSGALSSGHTRWRDIGAFGERLGCRKVFVFPNSGCRCLLLAGADQLDKTGEGILRMVSLVAPVQAVDAESPLDQHSALLPPDLPGVELEAARNPEGALRNVLERLAAGLPCRAAFLTIRSGDVFRVQAVWNLPPALIGAELAIASSPLLAEIANNGRGAFGFAAGLPAQQSPLPVLPPSHAHAFDAWLALPIVVGRRVIGHVSFGAPDAQPFATAHLAQAAEQVARLAYSVENAIVFAEAARYLQRLAMLNELASAASLGTDTDETASRVVHHLRRTFNTERVGLFLLAADNATLVEYGRAASGVREVVPVGKSLIGSVVETGQPLRVGETGDMLRRVGTLQASSALAVPLKYRGKIIGALGLESVECNAFSVQDEQLLVVIASHLAGLIENVRLNEETRQRAHQLQASVRQLQAARETALDIAGDLDLDTLCRRAVLRAGQLVDARGAELSLWDETERVTRVRISETPWFNNVGLAIPWLAGVAGRVVASGEPLVVEEYNAWSGRLFPDNLSPFRSVAGVPLKFRGEVIGALTVMDDRADKSFSVEDVQLLELLAPQVAVSIRNALLYQELERRIRAQRLAESRLLRSARLAAVGEMAAGVAHELNNPLTSVTGFVELTLDDLPGDAPYRADLELALREAQRARSVVRRLLDFSRPVEEVRVRADVNELVRDSQALLVHQLRTRGIETVLDLAENLPWALLDPNQIKQVLINLFHNALLAMPAGGLLILRTCEQSREERRWASIAVSDTGAGIAPEYLDRIFEPFFTTRPGGGGTGLGLSISYTIISDHGGFIEVTSQVGQGSCFTIFLPLENL